MCSLLSHIVFIFFVSQLHLFLHAEVSHCEWEFCIPHSTESVFDLNLSNNLITVCLDLLEKLTLGWDELGESLLERWLGAGGISAVGLGDDADVLLLWELSDSCFHGDRGR